MEAPKFTSYRLFITNRIDGGAGSKAIGDLRIFDGPNGTGTNILTGGTASASSTFGAGYEPSKAFDGDTVSRWSSVSDANNAWIRYDLPTAKAAKSFSLSLSTNPGNGPADFVVQGSNDGTTWTDIFAFKSFATSAQMATGKIANLSAYGLGGVALLDNGAPASLVILYEWGSWSFLTSASVGPDGAWALPVQSNSTSYLIAIIGPSGIRPQVHGPVVPEAYT